MICDTLDLGGWISELPYFAKAMRGYQARAYPTSPYGLCGVAEVYSAKKGPRTGATWRLKEKSDRRRDRWRDQNKYWRR